MIWGLSSVGLEHLPYKQRVGGSTPSAPTNFSNPDSSGFFIMGKFYVYILESDQGYHYIGQTSDIEKRLKHIIQILLNQQKIGVTG